MTARLHITRMRKAGGALLCKKISLGDGGKPQSDGSPCAMTNGTATRVEIVTGAAGLADLIADLDQSEALVLGDHVAEADEIRITRAKNADPARACYGRTLQTFQFSAGKPAVVLLDFDQKGMPDKVAELIDTLGGFETALSLLLPELDSYARVVRASTSAGIYNKETGEKFPSSGGQHLYLFAQDGADIPRFLRDLQARAWLEGLGWIMVAARGAKLVRSIVDTSVGSPERLVFEGPPLVVAPLAQDREARRPIAHDGELIDTGTACPPLTAEEERQFQSLVTEAKRAAEPEAEAAVEKAAEKLAQDCSVSIETARATIKASSDGRLLSWDEVHFDDDEIGVVSVADILADPEHYHDETLADPLEGRDYGKGKARLYYNGGGDARVHSFAHGGCIYRLQHCPDFVALQIEEAGQNAPHRFAELIPFMGGVDAVVRERLRDLAAKVGKVNKRPVNELVKQAQAKARRDEKEHRARNAPRGGGKPRDTRQKLLLLGGERPSALREIEKALRRPANVKDGAVLARGQTQVAIRFAVDPVKLRAGSAEIELPAGSAYLASAKPEHLQAQLDSLFAFTRVNKDGEEYATDCPGELARYTLVNAKLLPVMTISRTPVIRADGSVLEAPGYDPGTGIYYAPDEVFPPVPATLTRKDATQALERLRKPFRDFPFVTDLDRDAVIAEVLTLLTRHLVPRAPAFVHNAVEAGSGKTKLFDTVATIAIGTAAPLLNAEVLRDETELRKLLTTLTLSAAPLAVFDNAPRGEQINSPGLANYLTASVYGDRLLGGNEKVEAATCTTIGVTGNGVEIVGDLTRRMFRIDLDARCERPEIRSFDFDSEAEARQDRGELVVAALTILKAHALADRPMVEGRGLLGSFEEWDRHVAAAIVFAGGGDILKLLEKTRTTDPERDGLAEVLRMLECVGAKPGAAMKAGEIIAAVRTRASAVNALVPEPGDEEAEARMALVRRLGKDGEPDPTRFGRFLSKNANRVVAGMQLGKDLDGHDKVARYYVERTANTGSDSAGDAGNAGIGDGQFLSDAEKFRDREGVKNKESIRKQHGATPASPASPADEPETDDEPWEVAI